MLPQPVVVLLQSGETSNCHPKMGLSLLCGPALDRATFGVIGRFRADFALAWGMDEQTRIDRIAATGSRCPPKREKPATADAPRAGKRPAARRAEPGNRPPLRWPAHCAADRGKAAHPLPQGGARASHAGFTELFGLAARSESH